MPDPSRPRIAPLPAEDRVGPVAELLDLVRVPGAGEDIADANIFTTLVRHPRLFRRWTAFGGVLLTGSLPERHRELLILRTGWNCAAPYEWGQHVAIGLRSGLGPDEIDRLAGGPAEAWEPFESALVRAADELHTEHRIADETWAVLAGRYTTEQLIEVPMVVGHYHLVAMTLNSLGVEPEDGLAPFPD